MMIVQLKKRRCLILNIAIITGASSGLGKDYFYEVAKNYPDLDEIWLIARRRDRMEALAAEMPKVKTEILSLDLSSLSSFDTLSALLKEKEANVKILVNNAGVGKLGYAADEDYCSQTAMVDLNCRALTAMTCVVLPYMREGSFVINVCSIASFAPTPRMTVYSSTKAYVLSFSKSLREELKKRRVNVCAVCPGPMNTEFLDVADIKGNSKTFKTLPYCIPEKVAKASLTAAKKGRAVYTPTAFYKFYRVLAKLLPHNIVMKMSKT